MIPTPLTHRTAEWLSVQLSAQNFDTIKHEIRCAKHEDESTEPQPYRCAYTVDMFDKEKS